MSHSSRFSSSWPSLPLTEWQDTLETLHMWTQIVGKVRMTLSPHVNHWWEVPLYVSSVGLATSPIPYRDGNFEMEFDFLHHHLNIRTSDDKTKSLSLTPKSVANFYSEVMGALAALGIEVKIWPMPVEIPNPIRFDQDHEHDSYDPAYANRFWRILVIVDNILKEFRARYLGKVSPVHFFWGSFDLAVTRFSGRRAPPREGADPVTLDAYSQEVSSVGFWPGSGDITAPAFYSYAAPAPPDFGKQPVGPAKAFFSTQLSEFLLMYDDVRQASSPREALLGFFQSTYAAAANLAKWDRANLELTK
ncbi:MAG: DUF5996 family protein [Acidobacteriota bacterium]|nr:DUF5996 family protein [Acidobacteriota bacterium]